jgi:ABC-2 type transport system permease protein
MRPAFDNTWRLGIKELHSLRTDPIMVVLIVYIFTYAVYAIATGVNFEVRRAAVGIVDEDRSQLSRRIEAAVLEPYFKAPVELRADQIDKALDSGDLVFVIEVPPRFERDVLAGRRASVQVDIDATALTLAGNGAAYLQEIIARETAGFVTGRDAPPASPVDVVVRAKFNPNLTSQWFSAVMALINNISVVAVILTGAALLREREHGTIEHLLVMPVRPTEIMLAKIWANGLVIVVASILSLLLVVHWLLDVPIQGSIALFVVGAVVYQFSVTALGILLASFSASMPQFGLLAIPVLVIMYLLSGGTTPLESMPVWLQDIMQIAPSTHFVAFSQAVLYRAAGLEVVWPQLLALAGLGSVYFGVSLLRFRRVLVTYQ